MVIVAIAILLCVRSCNLSSIVNDRVTLEAITLLLYKKLI